MKWVMVIIWSIMSILGMGQVLDSTTQNNKDTTIFELVEWWNFDTALIPLHYEYDYSWDTLNVDEPKFSYLDSLSGIELILGDTGCGYYHPHDGEVTSHYGWRWGRIHKGIDIDLETGDPVYAAFDGVVRISKYNYGGYGHYVLIRHYNGLETLYGHLSERFVVPNQTIVKGQIIGLGGNTGRSTGSHLHFETRYKGEAVDPRKFIRFDEKCLVSDTVKLTVNDFAPHTNSSRYRTEAAKHAKYHKIRSGDTLWGLSRRYGVSVSYLCRINRISPSTTLRIGRTIRVR
jgi:hypothetical protein